MASCVSQLTGRSVGRSVEWSVRLLFPTSFQAARNRRERKEMKKKEFVLLSAANGRIIILVLLLGFLTFESNGREDGERENLACAFFTLQTSFFSSSFPHHFIHSCSCSSSSSKNAQVQNDHETTTVSSPVKKQTLNS